MNQYDFGQLISGKSTGFKAQMLRFILNVISQVYKLIVILRNFLYSKGWLKIKRVDAIVISVGNITVGGTGKTPFVIWLYKKITENLKLKAQNCKCAILTRGYKTHAKGRGTRIDEPAILTENCPRAGLIINPDRVAGANEAVNKFGADVLIMDDGFQHRRLARDLDIVTIDATRPFGYGKLLPAGLLREPIASLKRADAVIITRCNQVNEPELNQIEKTIRKIKRNVLIARSEHSPVCVKTADNKEINIEELKDKKIFAFCGIGNPDSFINTIKAIGANPAGAKIYDDHYQYTVNDISDMCKQAKELNADLMLTTQKDFSKLPIAQRRLETDMPFAYLKIELKLVSGEDAITQLIKNTYAGKIAKN